MPARLYLDQAATSWPKPESVYQAVDCYQRSLGAAAGRGGYAEAMEAAGAIQRARASVARLLGAEHATNIVFTFNGTDALNIAIHGALAHGGHVVTTVAEHNSVLRPLRMLERSGRVAVTYVAVDSRGVVDPGDIRRALRSDTTLIALTHASNVTGSLQPAAEVGEMARQLGILFLLDAAQTAGEIPIDLRELPVDLLAAPGHKGLLGPLGTGILFVRPGIEHRVECFRQGGTGTFSEDDRQPDNLPDKYEAGNLNVPGILGLGAGVEWLLERGVETVRNETVLLTRQLLHRLATTPGVTIHGSQTAQDRGGLISFTLAGIDPQELAAIFDSTYRIQVRAGLHCAPRMHAALDTLAQGGTVRVSYGPFNTIAEIDRAADAIEEVALQVAVT